MTSDTYTTAEVAKLLGVSTRRVRQIRAEGKLPFVLNEGGSASYPQTAVLALRRRKTGVEGRKSEGGSFGGSQGGSVLDLRELPGLAELIEAARRVSTIPSPVGTGYLDGSPEDAAYVKGFMYALRLVREPRFACGLNAALANVQGQQA